jgi:SAM-dependent methyltransferase
VAADLPTWHYGLVARWWAEFNVATTEELSYFRAAIRRYGEPALDLACGTGRILIPLLAEGFDVDGADISADMIAHAETQAVKRGLTPRLTVQPMHELDLDRTYRTIYMCGSLGLGGRRDHDREALRRAYRHLEPGGVLLIDHLLPYSGDDVASWAEWLPGKRSDLPGDWPAQGRRGTAADGDEIELLSREAAFDPLRQTSTLEMRARLWHGGQVIKEEAYSLDGCIYFAQEILLMLDEAGFDDLAVEAFSGRPATGDDGTVVFVARRGAGEDAQASRR